MRKQPLLKLIGVLNELDVCSCEIPGHIMDGIVDYLDQCKCCAFCKNYGSRYNCPENHEQDYDIYSCDYFDDRRDDDRYRQPNGLVWDFYKDIVKEVSHDEEVEKVK